MRIINGGNSEKRDQLKKLEPLALEALEIMGKQQKLVESAQFLMKKAGCPDDAMGQNPFSYCHDLLTSYGKLSLELKE